MTTYAEIALIERLSKDKRPRRPSVVEIARNVLGREFMAGNDGRYFLLQSGRWCPVNLEDVMRAANRRLVIERRPQITLNPAWAVS